MDLRKQQPAERDGVDVVSNGSLDLTPAEQLSNGLYCPSVRQVGGLSDARVGIVRRLDEDHAQAARTVQPVLIFRRE